MFTRKVNNWLESVKDYLCNLSVLSLKSTFERQIHCKVLGNASSDLKFERVDNTKIKLMCEIKLFCRNYLVLSVRTIDAAVLKILPKNTNLNTKTFHNNKQ